MGRSPSGHDWVFVLGNEQMPVQAWTRGRVGVPRSAMQRDAGAVRVRRGCDAGSDRVPMPPGAATIKEDQYTRHKYCITRHALGQRPGEFLSVTISYSKLHIEKQIPKAPPLRIRVRGPFFEN